jgi:site-specific recombinase XerD
VIKRTPFSSANQPDLAVNTDHRTVSVHLPRPTEGSERTSVFNPDDVRRLLDSIDASTPCGLRDRALIGVMFYRCARVGEALRMRVEDFYAQNRRLWVRLGTKRCVMPCGQTLEQLLTAYIQGAGLAADRKGLLFRADSHTPGELAQRTMTSFNVDRMIRQRAMAAGMGNRFSGYSFRIAGITALAENNPGLSV